VIFHLAGKTPPAEADVLDRANRLATVCLLDALKSIGRPVRVIVAGSAAELGSVPVEDLPVGEDYPCRPETDYGRSKLAATEAALAIEPPVEAIVARLFNPIGPGMPEDQSLGRFAMLLGNGTGPATLQVGSLIPRRDFIDVRDVAEALLALALRARPGLYHVGTGQSRSVGEGLEALIGLSGREVRVEVDHTRASGPSDSRADIRRIHAETGWLPRVSFEQSVVDLWTSAKSGRD
jgi:GDP-4-dehydro-6-deoxy-D-mannose reductase